MSGHIKANLQALFDSVTKTLRGFIDPLGNEVGGLPYILAQSGVPVILLPAGTVNASGQFTLGTALPYTPSGTVQVYVFAGVGLAAGLYQATFSSTTVCQLVGNPATTAGAYAGGTSQGTLGTVVIPGGAMGQNGCLRTTERYSMSNNANLKTTNTRIGVWTIGNNTNSGTLNAMFQFIAQNRGTQQAQIAGWNGYGLSYGQSGAALPNFSTVDTTVNQSLTFNVTLSNAADYIILESYTIEILPG